MGAYPHGFCPSPGVARLPTGQVSRCEVFRTKSNATTYTAGLNYQVTPDALIYGKISRGYRPGGANATAVPGTSPNFGPEFDRSIEFGGKADYSLGPARARTNLALFTDKYQKIQKLVTSLVNNAPVSVVSNVANGRVRGIELEQTVVPFRGMDLRATWSHLDAKYQQLSPADVAFACNSPYIGFCTLSHFAGTPKNMVTLAAHYTLPLPEQYGEVTIGGDWYTRSRIAVSDNDYIDPSAKSPRYSLLNLSASWNNVMRSNADLGVFVTNVTNKSYITGTNSLDHNLGIAALQWGEPRMFGVSVRYHFGGS